MSWSEAFNRDHGMHFERFYTREGRDVFEGVRFCRHAAEDGQEYLVPAQWGKPAADVLLEKVFYAEPLPALLRRVEEKGVPAWLWKGVTDDQGLDSVSAEWRYRFERDFREVLNRIAGDFTYRSWKSGVLTAEEDARIFYDEIRHVFLHQIAAPEISIWAKQGLAWAYGVEEAAPAGNPQKISVTLPVENTGSAEFIGRKRESELKRVAEEIGLRILEKGLHHVMGSCDRDDSFSGFDPVRNKKLFAAAQNVQDAGLPETAVRLALRYAEQGYEEIHLPKAGPSPEDLVETVLSVSDEFIETALTNHSFLLYEGSVPKKSVPAEKLWDSLAEAVWACGEPAISFRDSLGVAKTDGGLSITINLLNASKSKGIVDIAALRHVTRLLTAALAGKSLKLGVTNMAALLMGSGFAYDSEAARAIAALITALVSGTALHAAAEMGGAPAEKAFLQEIKDKMAVLAGSCLIQKGVTRRPIQIRTALCPDIELVAAAKQAWSEAYELGREKGFCCTHVTGINIETEIQALLGASSRDIAPEAALVWFEGDVSYAKKLNPAAERALVQLGYTAAEQEAIRFHALGHGTLLDAPAINHKTLREKGFHQAALDALESALTSALHIRYAFNKWTLGGEFCRHILGFSAEEMEKDAFDMLTALGFNEDDIADANLYCCGALTMEGAPHLMPLHLPVFDNTGTEGIRRVSAEAQIKMQAAVEQFLSGAVEHTILLDHYTAIDAVQKLILQAWELGVKRVKFYRENCSLLAPVALSISQSNTEEEELCLQQSTAA